MNLFLRRTIEGEEKLCKDKPEEKICKLKLNQHPLIANNDIA